MRERLLSLKPLAWVLPALLAFAWADRALDDVYGQHLTDKSTRKGRGQWREIKNHDAGIVVIGDSSGRYGVNAKLIGEATGIPAWNLASFLDAIPGHVSMLVDEMRSGRELKAVIIATTEQLFEKRAGRMKPAFRQYYVSPTAISLWIEHEGWDLEEVLDFYAAWASPTFRAGQGVQKWLLGIYEQAWRDQGLTKVRARLAKERAQGARWEHNYAADLGQTVAPTKGRPEHELVYDEKSLHGFLFSQRRPWALHPTVAGWYETLLEECEKHGVVVVQVFAPRMARYLDHPKYGPLFRDPIKRWAEETSKRHPNFVLAYPDGFRVERDELWNTASHVGPAAADRFTAGLLELLAPRLGIELPEKVRALAHPAP